MSFSRIAALAAASSLVLACADGPDAPTSPEVRLSHNAGNACQAVSSKEVKAEQSVLLAGANLRQAQTLWRAVESACSPTNANAANGALMAYISYVRGLYPAGFIQISGGQEGNFLTHIKTVFQHVGYAAPTLPGGAAGPLQGGVLGVIPASGSPNEVAKAGFGAMTLLQGDGLGHLIAMYPTDPTCLSVGNLKKIGTCVEVAAFPGLSTTASPAVKVQVGLCFPEGTTGGALGLGHETGGKTEVAGQLAYPEDCHPAEELAGSWNGGMSGIMKRLASIGKRTFGVSRAYASHAGLGGIGEALSEWGGLDLLVFAGSFNSAIGQPPVTTGTFGFTMDVAAPGSILVESALGEYTGPLAVLKQAGGNCGDACGRLLLRANLASASSTSYATEGVYDLSWIAVQTAPGVKEAPFIIASSDSLPIAKLTYKTRQSSNELYYNDTILVGTWERNKPLAFKVRVDFVNGTTTLYIGTPTTIPVAIGVASGRPFHNLAAANLASIAADFRGIDSGTMGWDEIGVQRIPDQTP